RDRKAAKLKLSLLIHPLIRRKRHKDYKVTREKTDFMRFKSDIRKYIDTGVPLAWSVMLGRVEEAGLAQPRGGHMRLIIGYNEKTDEVIYSDSWGPRHEFKKMDMGDAWSITMLLHLIAPRLQR
ncbi:MAG: C39 family peptidase, partial [Proteobacteria bacterium]|nr:C39 family peptidase [Pseudomonadota bacterium]